MPGYGSVVGTGSLMPESAYIKKMEQTCIYEDPDIINNYMRASLKDVRPDKPLFESDMTRRNNFSEDRLNLRSCGRRSTALPDLPDGTFLDFDGLERDPRGFTTQPDMMQHRRQQEARGKFIKKYNDDDYSVPESGISEPAMIKLIRKPFYEVKDRYKNFEESMDGFHNGGVNQFKRTNRAECSQVADERAPEMRDEMCYTRAGKINDLSNNTSIGWRRTTDHVFKVAKYGMQRKSMPGNKQNFLKNRSNAYIEHDVHVQWKDQNALKSISMKMIDLAKQKKRDMNTAEGVIWDKSMQSQASRKKRITPLDLIAKQSYTDESQETNPNMLLNNERGQHLTGNMITSKLDSNKFKKVVVDPFIIQHMVCSTRNRTKKRLSDLRNEVAESAAYYGLLTERNNRITGKEKRRNKLLWDSIANYEKGMSMRAANYRHLINHNTNNSARNKNTYDGEEYKRNQKIFGQRRGNISNPSLYVTESTEYDQDAGMELAGAKMVGGLGSKYMRGHMDRGDIDYQSNVLQTTASIKNRARYA
jgi:hypothetical protein